MDLTTKARIKALRGILTTDSDDLIDQIIANVSARFESVLARHTLTQAYTETYELPRARKVVWLRGFPVSSITSIRYTEEPGDTSVDALTANEDYYLDSEDGTVRLRNMETPYDPGFVAVTYTGGMAATTAAFITAFPDIAAACDAQVVYEMNRRSSPGGSISTRDGKSDFADREVNLLSGVREVLASHSRTIL